MIRFLAQTTQPVATDHTTALVMALASLLGAATAMLIAVKGIIDSAKARATSEQNTQQMNQNQLANDAKIGRMADRVTTVALHVTPPVSAPISAVQPAKASDFLKGE